MFLASLNRESQYTLACLAWQITPAAPLPQTPQDMDWAQWRADLQQNRLLHLFAGWAKKPVAAQWPDALRQELHQERLRTLFAGERYAGAVGQVLSAFRQQGIETIVLKGWALIPLIYQGDLSLRIYDDIDLLVHPRDQASAEAQLQALGYASPAIDVWPGFHFRYRNGRAFLLPRPTEKAINVGLHWGLLDTPYYDRRISVSDLFARSTPLQVAGQSVRQLHPSDHFVYSCGHLALHHAYHPALLRYYELARYLQHLPDGPNWEEMLARALAWRLLLPLRTTLAMIEERWPGLVPASILQTAVAYQPGFQEERLHSLITHHTANPVVRAALHLLTLPGLFNRVRYLAEVAVPSPGYIRKRYGNGNDQPTPLTQLYFQRYANFARFLGNALASRRDSAE